MKKFIKNNIFGFIIGIIFTSGISVLAVDYLYYSEDVSYNDKSVENALNELYQFSSKESSYLFYYFDSDSTSYQKLYNNLYFVGTNSNSSDITYDNTTGIITIHSNGKYLLNLLAFRTSNEGTAYLKYSINNNDSVEVSGSPIYQKYEMELQKNDSILVEHKNSIVSYRTHVLIQIIKIS